MACAAGGGGLAAAQGPPPQGPEESGGIADRADTAGQSPGHMKARPVARRPLAIPCFPESHPKCAFKICLLKIREISDNHVENKLPVTDLQGVCDTPGSRCVLRPG